MLETEQAVIKETESNDNQNNRFPSVNFFKLQFKFTDSIDNIFFVVSLIGAIVWGVCIPMLSLLFGNALSEFGSNDPTQVTLAIKNVALNLVWVGLGAWVSSFLCVALANILCDRYCKKIKVEYFKVLLRQEQGFFDQINSYELSTKVQGQLKIIRTGLGAKVGNFIQSFVLFAVSYIIGFITSWKLSLILMSIVPFIVIGAYFMISGLTQAQSKAQKYYEKAGGLAEEILYNIKTVASFSNFKFEKERFGECIEYSFQKGKYGGMISSISRSIILFFIFGSFGLSIGVGAIFIIDKEVNRPDGKLFSVGDVITVIFSIIFGSFALGQSAPHLKAIANSCEASRELFYLLDRKCLIDESNSILKPEREKLTGRINFRNITFFLSIK